MGGGTYVVGNWKMHGVAGEAADFLSQLSDASAEFADVTVVLCPQALNLPEAVGAARARGLNLGGQDCGAAIEGAHTGEISARALASYGASHCIVGHSETRAAHRLLDEDVAAKARAAAAAGLVPIVCVGEESNVRDAGEAEAFVARQIAALAGERWAGAAGVMKNAAPEDGAGVGDWDHRSGSGSDGGEAATPGGRRGDAAAQGADKWDAHGRSSTPPLAAPFLLAYEPIWAIGAGRTPDARSIAAMMRAMTAALQTHGLAENCLGRLYGGSVAPDNAGEILGIEGVDGVLAGSASRDVSAFSRIIDAARLAARRKHDGNTVP